MADDKYNFRNWKDEKGFVIDDGTYESQEDAYELAKQSLLRDKKGNKAHDVSFFDEMDDAGDTLMSYGPMKSIKKGLNNAELSTKEYLKDSGNRDDAYSLYRGLQSSLDKANRQEAGALNAYASATGRGQAKLETTPQMTAMDRLYRNDTVERRAAANKSNFEKMLALLEGKKEKKE